MNYNFIVKSGNISYDGETFINKRESNEKDQLILNTEGPIHLKTLSKILGVKELKDYDNDEQVTDYLKKMYKSSLNIFNLINKQEISFAESKDSQKSRLRRDPYIPIKPLPVFSEDLNWDEDFKFETREKSPAPLFSSLIKNISRNNTIQIVKNFYNTEGHEKLEGCKIEKLANIIARSGVANIKSKDNRNYTLEVIKAFNKLGMSGEISLSIDKKHISPFIPTNIRTLIGNTFVDEIYLDSIISSHIVSLSKVNNFEKLVNMFENSCVKKLCMEMKSKAPAYYAAERFVKQFVYVNINIPC